MKRILILLCCLIAIVTDMHAQPVLYGLTFEPTTTNASAETLCKFNTATNSLTPDHQFLPSGIRPTGKLLRAWDGKFYGLTNSGGNGNGTIFSFDPYDDNYTELYSFVNAANLTAGLVQFWDGKLYGLTNTGGAMNAGMIFSFNPLTQVFTILKEFNGTDGSQPLGGLMKGSDGLLYGMTSHGGANNAGVIFSFDPGTSSYTKLKDFDIANGASPAGDLTEGPDGKIYGMTPGEGTTTSGVIFSFDPVTAVYTRLYQFTSSTGRNPYGTLFLASDGKFYATTAYGGTNNAGVIFSFDPATSFYTRLKDFDGTNGSNSFSNLMEATDGKLYGTTTKGGAGNFGVIYSFVPAGAVYARLADFDGANGSVFTNNSALVEMGPCVSPDVAVQPLTTQLVAVGATPTSLSIAVTGNGLTYQWFANTDPSSNGATNLNPAGTGASYVPPTAATGAMYYYCEVTGVCGSLNSNIAEVIVTDQPICIATFNCPPDTVLQLESTRCSKNVTIPNPAFSSTCGVASFTWVMTGATQGSSPANGINFVGTRSFNAGITFITYTLKDTLGNITTCTPAVTLTGGRPLNINCPNNKTITAPSNSCYATNVNLGNPSINGCGTLTVTNDAPVQFPLGITYVTWTVSNADGETRSCTQKITVTGGIPVNISCPSNKTVSADEGQCYATNVDLGTPSVTGCGTLTVTNNAPAQFPVGTTTVTWKAKDENNHTKICTQLITVNGGAALSISCPPNKTVNANPDRCFATNVQLGTPTTTGCGTLAITNNAPSHFPIGTTIVTWKVKDANHNTRTCTQTIKVIDNQSPVIHCPANITQTASNGQCNKRINTPDPSIHDNCGISKLTWTMSGATSCSSSSNGINFVEAKYFNCGITTVTYKIWDASNNMSTCSFTVTVNPGPHCSGDERLITENSSKAIPSVEETISNEMKVTVFPNPASEYFNIDVQTAGKETVEIRVINMQGKTVQQEKGAPDQRYRLGDRLTAGMYFIEVKQAGNISVTKVIKL